MKTKPKLRRLNECWATVPPLFEDSKRCGVTVPVFKSYLGKEVYVIVKTDKER